MKIVLANYPQFMILYSTFDAGVRYWNERNTFQVLLARAVTERSTIQSILPERASNLSNCVLTGNSSCFVGPLGKERSRHRVKPPCSIRAMKVLSGSSEQPARIGKRRFGKTVARGSDQRKLGCWKLIRIPATKTRCSTKTLLLYSRGVVSFLSRCPPKTLCPDYELQS